MQNHVKVIGVLYIVYGSLGILLGLFLFALLAGIGIAVDDNEASPILAIIGTVLGFFFTVLSIPNIIAGVWLMRYREWARILTIILAFLHLLNFPLGTALGVYALVILLSGETAKLFNPVTPVPGVSGPVQTA